MTGESGERSTRLEASFDLRRLSLSLIHSLMQTAKAAARASGDAGAHLMTHDGSPELAFLHSLSRSLLLCFPSQSVTCADVSVGGKEGDEALSLSFRDVGEDVRERFA